MTAGTQGPNAHYFDEDPSVDSDRRQIELTLPDLRLALTTDRGVFAADRIDTGTKLLLLEGPSPRAGDRHLVDVGAGYGPIALTLAHRNPDATVWAVEPNARARGLCTENAAAQGLDNVRVIDPAEFDPSVPIDRIWSNPPIRIGKRALHELITLWLGRLAPHGSAHFVVQRHLGADSLHSWLERNDWVVDRRAARKAFRLLDVAHPTSFDPDPAEKSPTS